MRVGVQPARLDQIRRAYDGTMIVLDAEAGGVAADLRAIDPCLHVCFSPESKCFIVYWESEDGRDSYMVLSVNAHQNNSGVYEGLDERVVQRIRQIDPQGRGGYKYAEELEQAARRRQKAQADARHEMLGELGELAAHAVRKDLGARYKGRSFIPRDIA